jgi:origin recognition complex subunit 5
MLYDSVLNTLSRWNPSWDHGCANWNTGDGERWNENFDGFVHGLCSLYAQLLNDRGERSGKGKGNRSDGSESGADVRLVIVVERAEKLKETLPDLIVPLARLAELVCDTFFMSTQARH